MTNDSLPDNDNGSAPPTEEETTLIPDDDYQKGDTAEKKLRAALKRAEEEKKEYLEGWQRAKADFINYKKDEARRLEDIARFVAKGFLADILPILDSFHLALTYEAPREGGSALLLIRSQLDDTLRKRGLEEITATCGEPFNPELHESLGEVAADFPEGTIGEIVQKGYRAQNAVLRPVRVRLTKK